MYRIVLAAITALLLIAVLPGCSQPEPTPEITGPAYTQSIAEAMLKALSTGDYQGYCLYLSEKMAPRMTQEVFGYFEKFYEQRIGEYISLSLKLSDVKVSGNETTVVYKAKYTLEDEVTVTVVFISSNGKIAVDNLYLNSPKLLEQ